MPAEKSIRDMTNREIQGRRYLIVNPPVVAVALASWALVALVVAWLFGWLS